MQVGAWQLDLRRDVRHRGSGKPFFGKNLFGPEEDFFDVAAPNFDLVIAHAWCPCRRASLMNAE
jgi:hypothetical protein